MSIVPLVKVTLYGPAAEKDAVLDGLQRLGCLHLNDLHRGDAVAVDLTFRRSDAREALQYLHDSPVRRRALRHMEKVDYEATVRGALARLLRTEGFRVQSFEAAEAFLAASLPDAPGCLLLDLQMPGLNGLDLQAELAGRDPDPGMSLLRLAQGRVDLALPAIRRALDEVEDPTVRSRLLPACV